VSFMSNDFQVLFPEILLAIGGMALLVLGVLRGDRSLGLVSWLAIILLVATGWFVLFPLTQFNRAFHGAFIADDFARFAKILILMGTGLTILMSKEYLEREKIAHFEFPVLLVLSTVGMFLMVSASSFIAVYMGLELQSLALYVLAAFNRDSLKSSEAGLKYFVLGALSSGMMLYGISLIYGFTGTTEFSVIAHVVTSPINIGLVFGIVFLIVGFAFKVSAVPFHMWTPDVYEGSPTPITAFFSMAPKVAAMALFLRAMIVPFAHAAGEWQQIVIFISALSMILGAVAAIGQTNIKRLMAYSSIGHMGYALLGLAAGTTAGVEGVLIYMTIYLITNAGVFVCILAMRRDGEAVETISDLAGLARTRPILALAFAALMLSLAGLPPFAGFLAKFYIFLAVVAVHMYALAVLGVLASVVGAYYYLRIVKIMYFDDPAPAFDPDMSWNLKTILTGSSLFVVWFVASGGQIVSVAAASAKALLP
jgi:NADH-quinone oxidoreductase subunit N